MTQPEQPQEPTLGDLVIRDLENQIAVDTRYAAKCRELALIRAQYTQLMTFVRSKADVLGLEVSEDGLLPSKDESVQEEPVKEEPTDQPQKINGKQLPVPNSK